MAFAVSSERTHINVQWTFSSWWINLKIRSRTIKWIIFDDIVLVETKVPISLQVNVKSMSLYFVPITIELCKLHFCGGVKWKFSHGHPPIFIDRQCRNRKNHELDNHDELKILPNNWRWMYVPNKRNMILEFMRFYV